MAKTRRLTSGFLSLPSSRLGRFAGWLLVVALVLIALNTAFILPFTRSRPGLDAVQSAVNLLAGGSLVVSGATGLLAMILQRDRSWTLVSSVVLLLLVFLMVVLDLTGHGP